MQDIPSNRKLRRFFALLLPPLLFLGGVVLLVFDPLAEGAVYPPCVFHAVGRLHCPGCGSTRALSRLVRFDFFGAVSYNPLVVLALPFIGYYLLALEVRTLTGRQLPVPDLHPVVVRVIAIGIVFFWVARNLPVAPFTWLAP